MSNSKRKQVTLDCFVKRPNVGTEATSTAASVCDSAPATPLAPQDPISDTPSVTALTASPSTTSITFTKFTHSSPVPSDIGSLPIDQLRHFPDTAKLQLLTTRYQKEEGWNGPLHLCSDKKNRRVPDEFFDSQRYPTLRYSISQDGLYCVVCMLFSSGNLSLRTQPLRDWSNAKKLADKHLLTENHRSAQHRASEFIRVCQGKKSTVITALSQAHAEQAKRNMRALKIIVEALVVCGKQNIAPRGHTDERSNFKAILNYRAQGDESLMEHIKTAPKNASYMGHSVQNELLELCGAQILSFILNKCKAAKWFTILVDESADVSCTEQIAFCVRFVDKENGAFQLREYFLGCAPTRDTRACTLADIILEKLKEWDLNPAYMIGQGYDGAANMSGGINGVQAVIRRHCPNAVYVHCRNHCLNLAIVHSCKVPVVRNVLNVVQELVGFITASPQRLQAYLDNTDDKERLKKFSETRWSQHDACLHAVIEKYEEIVATLDSLQQVQDTKTRATASNLAKSIDNFDFLVACIVCQKLLQYLTPLSNALQDPSCDLVKASGHAGQLVAFLQDKRQDFASALRQRW
jgi:hypothetical protein